MTVYYESQDEKKELIRLHSKCSIARPPIIILRERRNTRRYQKRQREEEQPVFH
jgi:hypothetical protein